jgi:hypothetical protein
MCFLVDASAVTRADGILWWGAKRYIGRLLETYERVMKEKAKTRMIPMPEKAQPELDDSSELDENGRAKYQSLIGCLRWVVTLGRFDIACAVMTMLRFHIAPRQGHLEMLGHIFGYLRKYPNGAIRFHVGIPPHETRFTPSSASWERSVYGEPFEEIPENAPPDKGKPVHQTSMFDANLVHCSVADWAAMGGSFFAPSSHGSDGYVRK